MLDGDVKFSPVVLCDDVVRMLQPTFWDALTGRTQVQQTHPFGQPLIVSILGIRLPLATETLLWMLGLWLL